MASVPRLDIAQVRSDLQAVGAGGVEEEKDSSGKAVRFSEQNLLIDTDFDADAGKPDDGGFDGGRVATEINY